MPEETKTEGGFVDLKAENDKVHAQLEQQSQQVGLPEFNSDTDSALDALLKERETKKEDEDTKNSEGDGKPADSDGAAGDDSGKAGDSDGVAGDDSGKAGDSDGAAGDDLGTAGDDLGTAGDGSPGIVEPKTDEEDPFKDTPSLPEGASAKATEAFNGIKERAKVKISEYETKLAEAQRELDELKANRVPQETAQELEELRKFRAKLDIEADPEFKKWERDIAQSEEFIYAQLRKSPNIDDEIISDIKKYGGPSKVKMDKILDTIEDKTIRRLVESKLGDIELHRFNQEQAIKTAKENVAGYVEERRKAWEQTAVQHNRETEQHLSGFLQNLNWTKEVAPKKGATDEEKKQVQEHNQFVRQVNSELKEAIADDSPKMRATLLTGLAQFFYLQRAHKATVDELTQLRTENKELSEKLARFKKASVGRLKDSTAPSTGAQVPPKEVSYFNQRPEEALDKIRDQILAERARAGA